MRLRRASLARPEIKCYGGVAIERSVHSHTPVLLSFSVSLPSIEATGRWRERRQAKLLARG
jgi:hypothetical protein